MAEQVILALDQGTTSSRTIAFDREGRIVAQAQREFTQHYPQPGWVEHDAEEIWDTQLATLEEVVVAVGRERVAALGIANQRETTVLWDRESGRPVHPAIVWQDRRTADLCAEIRRVPEQEELLRARTGLRADPYFSATKLRWVLDRDADLARRAAAGGLCFGTVDSRLPWTSPGGPLHATEV